MLDHRTDTFLTLCDTMNYREAAERLHISQPAVTQHIQFLEREYGRRLFSYENRVLQKTEAAQILERYLRAMRYNDKELRQRLSGGTVRELRIGATKTSLIGISETPSSLFFAFIILGEVLTLQQGIGSALIMGSIAVITIGPILAERKKG